MRKQDWLFHYLAPFYDYLIRRPQIDRLKDLLDLPPDGVMIDVGGGTGMITCDVKAGIADMRIFAIKNNTRGDVTIVNGASTFTTIEYDRAGNVLVANPEVHQLDAQVTLTSTFAGGQLIFNNRGMTATPGTVTVTGRNGLARNIAVSFAGSSQVQ